MSRDRIIYICSEFRLIDLIISEFHLSDWSVFRLFSAKDNKDLVEKLTATIIEIVSYKLFNPILENIFLIIIRTPVMGLIIVPKKYALRQSAIVHVY